MSPVYASTLGDVGGVVAAVATLGLLGAAIWAGVIAVRSLRGVEGQLELMRDQFELQREALGTLPRRRVYELLGQLFQVDFIEWSAAAA